MNKLLIHIIFLITFTSLSYASLANSEDSISFSFGKEIDSALISRQDITIDALGNNLPEGSGTALIGEKIFLNKCVSCHLEKEFFNTKILLSDNIKSIPINLDWPYPKTLFDYIRKAICAR